MKFLIWENEQDAIDSLAAINQDIGCPYIEANSYRMDQWDFVTKSESNEEWGFFSSAAEHMQNLVGTFNQVDNRPEDWAL